MRRNKKGAGDGKELQDEEIRKYSSLFKQKVNSENLDGVRIELIKSQMQ